MQAYFLTKASGQWCCYLPCKTAGEVLLKAGLTSDYRPDDETSLQFWDDIYEKGVKSGLIRPEHLFVVWSKEEQSLINAAEALLLTEQLSVPEYRDLMASVYKSLNIFTRHLIQFTFEEDENHFKRVSNDQPEGETFFDNIYRWSYPHLDEDVPHWHTYTTAETDVRNGIEDAVKYKVQTKLPLTNYDRSVLDLL